MAVARNSYSWIDSVPNTLGCSGHYGDPVTLSSERDPFGNDIFLPALTEHILRKEGMPSGNINPTITATNEAKRIGVMQAIRAELGNRAPRGTANPEFWKQQDGN
jgi:hypothetical protein